MPFLVAVFPMVVLEGGIRSQVPSNHKPPNLLMGTETAEEKTYLRNRYESSKLGQKRKKLRNSDPDGKYMQGDQIVIIENCTLWIEKNSIKELKERRNIESVGEKGKLN
jgi:hypothetical protein